MYKMKKGELSVKAYNYLFEKIVTSELAPGAQIVEGEICEILNISRTPVRQAMHRLEAEGLIYRIKNVGTIVSEITYEDITEIFEIRKLYELHALKNYVKEVSDEEVTALRDQLLQLDAASGEMEFYNADRAVHTSIMRYCSNSRMVNNLQTINAQIEKLRRISANTPKRLLKSKAEHLEIVQAVLERDYEKACAKLDYHLEEVKHSVIQVYHSSKFDTV